MCRGADLPGLLVIQSATEWPWVGAQPPALAVTVHAVLPPGPAGVPPTKLGLALACCGRAVQCLWPSGSATKNLGQGQAVPLRADVGMLRFADLQKQEAVLGQLGGCWGMGESTSEGLSLGLGAEASVF